MLTSSILPPLPLLCPHCAGFSPISASSAATSQFVSEVSSETFLLPGFGYRNRLRRPRPQSPPSPPCSPIAAVAEPRVPPAHRAPPRPPLVSQRRCRRRSILFFPPPSLPPFLPFHPPTTPLLGPPFRPSVRPIDRKLASFSYFNHLPLSRP